MRMLHRSKFIPGLLCLGLLTAGLHAQPQRDRMVVVISLDGFPAYALDDPKLPIPTLRKLAANGVAARMETVNPTVTWPNHTSMVTGVRSDQHGLLANGSIVRSAGPNAPTRKVEPMVDKVNMVRVPTVYDAVHDAGFSTAQVNWVAINKAPTIDFSFAEWGSAAGPLEREMIAKGIIAAADVENFTKSNILFRDQVWTKAAAYLIASHKPNLLLMHLLSLDSTHHTYGPGTLAAQDAIAFLDGCVGRVVDAVHAAGLDSRTTFLIVSDHGFKKYTKVVRPVVAIEKAGLAQQVFVLPEGGTAYVYFDAPGIESQVRAAFSGVEGIADVIGPDRFASLGLPGGAQAADAQPYQLLLTAKDGYSFLGSTGGPVTAAAPQAAGSHGYLAGDPDMDAIFIASGAGVKAAAASPGKVRNIDVASTIAAIFGVKLPSALGKPIPLE